MDTKWGLAACIIVCFAAAGVGGMFTSGALSDWYAALKKPPWNPPSWVFGPVWTILYAAMGVSWWLALRGAPGQSGLITAAFIGHLVLNVAWSAFFFGLRRPDLAFAEIMALWLVILGLALWFRNFDLRAAWLLIPYLAWVTFASALNCAIWRLNAVP